MKKRLQKGNQLITNGAATFHGEFPENEVVRWHKKVRQRCTQVSADRRIPRFRSFIQKFFKIKGITPLLRYLIYLHDYELLQYCKSTPLNTKE